MKTNETSYSTETLLKSGKLASYQPDFARALLKEPYYTLSQAKKALEQLSKEGA